VLPKGIKGGKGCTESAKDSGSKVCLRGLSITGSSKNNAYLLESTSEKLVRSTRGGRRRYVRRSRGNLNSRARLASEDFRREIRVIVSRVSG